MCVSGEYVAIRWVINNEAPDETFHLGGQAQHLTHYVTDFKTGIKCQIYVFHMYGCNKKLQEKTHYY